MELLDDELDDNYDEFLEFNPFGNVEVTINDISENQQQNLMFKQTIWW